ncbi:hypothetical protein ACFFGT_04915 [Mucilaginibacter angelicae]|uniref:DUF2116 family Zn-ribbon domain-containing protein n=1 Tax=Mucilaginibacter angelicae TaxID=869718 RepID=A0ABV6L1C6_9SPHI
MITDEVHDGSVKTCLECGKPLGTGRSDRKFCNDICRTAFNNRRRLETMPVSLSSGESDSFELREAQDMRQIIKIQEILLENRFKLFKMIGPGDFMILLTDFYGYNINLKYFTNEYKDTDRDLVFRMCFDYGYHIDGNMVYLIYNGMEIYHN